MLMVERLKQPATIWKLVLFVFWLGVTWSSLNYRVSRLEEFQDTVDIIPAQFKNDGGILGAYCNFIDRYGKGEE